MTHYSTRTGWLLAFALLCCAVGATAQTADPLKGRMSVSYQGAPIGSVFKALANVLACNLQLDPKVSGTVTLEVRNVTTETVLRAVCESAGCRWRLDRGQLVVEVDPGAPDRLTGLTVTDVHQEIAAHIQWNDAPLDAVAKTFAKMLDAQLMLDPSLVSARVSLDQSGGSAWSALSAICQQATCRWRMVSEPRRILAIFPVATKSFDAELPPGAIRVGDPGVTAPKLVHRAGPRYTEQAKQAKVEGVVVVECIVQSDGSVGQVRVVRSLDRIYGLDGEAVLAAKLHVFEPGLKDGKPVPVATRLTFSFALR
jgi:TonB family protein